MPFHEDAALAEAVGPVYGKYQASFHSDGGQVRAHLFERRGKLVAHVAFTPGLKGENVTDRYYTDLQQYAAEHGFADRFRLVYADQ